MFIYLENCDNFCSLLILTLTKCLSWFTCLIRTPRICQWRGKPLTAQILAVIMRKYSEFNFYSDLSKVLIIKSPYFHQGSVAMKPRTEWNSHGRLKSSYSKMAESFILCQCVFSETPHTFKLLQTQPDQIQYNNPGPREQIWAVKCDSVHKLPWQDDCLMLRCYWNTKYLRVDTCDAPRTHLHTGGCQVLVVVVHHVGKEGHVVGHPQAPMHSDGLAGEQTVGGAAPRPQHGQAGPQRSRQQHGGSWIQRLDVLDWSGSLFGSAQNNEVPQLTRSSAFSSFSCHLRGAGRTAAGSFPSLARVWLWVTDKSEKNNDFQRPNTMKQI